MRSIIIINQNRMKFQITQISCYDTTLAPSGCTQYYFGSTTGMVNSYNYANQYQLANQKQNICIRLDKWNHANQYQVSNQKQNVCFSLEPCNYVKKYQMSNQKQNNYIRLCRTIQICKKLQLGNQKQNICKVRNMQPR